jgi:hypothetical protein
MTREEINNILDKLNNVENDLSLLHESGLTETQKKLIQLDVTNLHHIEDFLLDYKKTLPANTIPSEPQENTVPVYEHIEDPKQDALDSFNQLDKEQIIDNS